MTSSLIDPLLNSGKGGNNMQLYVAAIATGLFQCKGDAGGMWSAAGSWGVIGDVGMGIEGCVCV